MNITNIENRIKWEQYYSPNFNWNDINLYKQNKLSEEFIEEFADKLVWPILCTTQTLSLDFIRKHKNQLFDWVYIPWKYKLTEDFIREFADKIDWFNTSVYQKLSESFIEEFADMVHWDLIFEYQNLSPEFQKKWEYKLYEH